MTAAGTILIPARFRARCHRRHRHLIHLCWRNPSHIFFGITKKTWPLQDIRVMDETGQRYMIIVVDDGSQDRTAEVVQSGVGSIATYLVRHPENRGLHESLRSGIKAFLDLSEDAGDVLVAMDADNTHEPSSCPQMIRLISEEGYDVVIASRYRPGSKEIGLSVSRLVMSRVVNLMLAALFKIEGVRDYTCGFRAYGKKVLDGAWRAYGNRLIESATFSATAEILLKMGKMGIRAVEVPFVLRYDQKGGASKMKVLATVLDYFRMMVRVRRTPIRIEGGD